MPDHEISRDGTAITVTIPSVVVATFPLIGAVSAASFADGTLKPLGGQEQSSRSERAWGVFDFLPAHGYFE